LNILWTEIISTYVSLSSKWIVCCNYLRKQMICLFLFKWKFSKQTLPTFCSIYRVIIPKFDNQPLVLYRSQECTYKKAKNGNRIELIYDKKQAYNRTTLKEFCASLDYRLLTSQSVIYNEEKKSILYISMDPKCSVCEKTAYATERIMVNGKAYHKPCFRCTHCKSVLKWVVRD